MSYGRLAGRLGVTACGYALGRPLLRLLGRLLVGWPRRVVTYPLIWSGRLLGPAFWRDWFIFPLGRWMGPARRCRWRGSGPGCR